MTKENIRMRVVFHSVTDLSCGHELSMAEPILKKFNASYSTSDINDIFELEQIKKYLEAEVYLEKWTEEDRTLFKSYIDPIGKLIGRFLSTLNDNTILGHYEGLYDFYHDIFWRLMNDRKIYKNVSSEIFTTILSRPHVHIREILKHKNLVNHYKKPIRDFLLDYSYTAELLIGFYGGWKENDVYFPNNLTLQDKEGIISAYLDKEKVNLNHLNLLVSMRNSDYFSIDDMLRHKARQLLQKKWEEIRKDDGNKSTVFSISISDQKLFEKGKDPIALIENFRTLFHFLDSSGRINLISKPGEMGMSRIFGIHTKDRYPVSDFFRFKELRSYSDLCGYNEVLSDQNINLEEMIAQYVNEYLQKKYQIANLLLTMPSKNTTYLERITTLAPAVDSLLKQYNLFVKYGEIDPEFLRYSSDSISFSNISSLLEKKYCYISDSSSDIITIQNLLFSDQSMIGYVPSHDENTFFELVEYSNVEINEFANHQLPRIEHLKNKNYIVVDETGKLLFNNREKILILKDLHNIGYISYYHYPIHLQRLLDEMEAQQLIRFGSTLFSKQEQDYFNYFLNRSKFMNGFNLRNSYVHGSQGVHQSDEEHRQGYYKYLKLLILAILKIEDDLYLSIKSKK